LKNPLQKNTKFFYHQILEVECMQKKKHRQPLLLVAGAVLACLLFLLSVRPAFATLGTFEDEAKVLDQTKVRDAAHQIEYTVSVYTTTTFDGSKAAFDAGTKKKADRLSTGIVINIDTKARHLAIYGGSKVPLKKDQYDAAISAFRNNMHGSDYTSATVAAINSLAQALKGDTSFFGQLWASVKGLASCLGIGFLILVVVVINIIWPSRRRSWYGHHHHSSSSYDVGGSSFDSSSSSSSDSGSSGSSGDF